MKAAIVDTQGAELKIGDVPVPEPADDQILVKSIYAAINPVFVMHCALSSTLLIDYRDNLMVDSGILVLSWPFIPGCDAGGVVVKAGKNAISTLGTAFKEGDQVFGCTRLGSPGYSTYEEYVSHAKTSLESTNSKLSV